jgi:ABC-type multidrug transport system fused ATPase/permease subunit
MNAFTVYFKYVFEEKKLYIPFLVFLVISVTFGNLVPLTYELLVEIIQKGEFERFHEPLLLITGAFLFSAVANYIMEWLLIHLYWRVYKDMKTEAVYKLLEHDHAYHASKSSGKLVTKINRLGNALFSFFYIFNTWVFRGVLDIIIPVILIYSISAIVGLSVLGVIIVWAVLMFFLVRWSLQHYEKKLHEPEEAETGVLVDNLAGFGTVKAFAKEEFEKKRYKDAVARVENTDYKVDLTYRIINIAINTVSLLIIVVSVFLIMELVESKEMSLGQAVVIIGFVFQFTGKLFGLVYDSRSVFKGYTDFSSFAEILQEKPEVNDPVNPVILKNPKGEIKFNDILFKYEESVAVKDLNLTINSGQTVALVGPSGAGKSTMIKLLLRYYDVDEGQILIDGVNIRDMNQKNLRDIIGLVPQDPVMFNNTILYNVGYSLDNPTEEQVESACKAAQIHDFILTLPDRYKTVVGERGVKLSGGQRQRLAIARMILKNPKIVIFDEATSMLDSESESLIQKAFSELSKDKTVIIIAHRLSTIVRSDKIIVVNGGAIEQSGSHQDLISAEGLYKKLWDIQSGGFIPTG